jgi:hypothetical protein
MDIDDRMDMEQYHDINDDIVMNHDEIPRGKKIPGRNGRNRGMNRDLRDHGLGINGRNEYPGMGMQGAHGMGGHGMGGHGMGGLGMGGHGMSGGMNGGRKSFNEPSYQNNFNNINNGHSSSWFGSLYEMIMLMFLIGFIFNCFFGKNQNDKYAINWYNANKQYFEERYEMIGLGKDENQEEVEYKMPDDCPLIKDNAYVYKFYSANYRYIKWLLVVLEVIYLIKIL